MKVTCPHCNQEFEINPFGGKTTPIRQARMDMGLSIDQAAADLDISAHSLRELERGKMNPRLSTMRAASRIYNKSIDELFPVPAEGETEDMAEEPEEGLPADE